MRRIAANYMFTVDSEPVKNGYVEVDDNGTIIGLGQLTNEIEDTEFYNGIICPGFVNAHCHVELSHLAGYFKEDTGMSGFINQINTLRLTVDKERRLNAINEQMDKMYRDGVNGMGDISNCNESFAKKASSPIFTHTYLEQFGWAVDECGAIMDNARKLLSCADSFGLAASITPHSCYTMCPELLENCISAGLERGYISYHSQESPEEEELIRTGTGNLADNYRGRNMPTPKVTGRSALDYFIGHAKSAVRRGQPVVKQMKDGEYAGGKIKGKVLLVHNVTADRESINEALQTFENLYWATCPLSNWFIHRQYAPLNLMHSMGLKVCIGTDSLSSNHHLSMIDEMKCIMSVFKEIPLADIIKWATLNGAEAIGADKLLGSFTVGKKPGVVLMENADLATLALTEQSSSKRLV